MLSSMAKQIWAKLFFLVRIWLHLIEFNHFPVEHPLAGQPHLIKLTWSGPTKLFNRKFLLINLFLRSQRITTLACLVNGNILEYSFVFLRKMYNSVFCRYSKWKGCDSLFIPFVTFWLVPFKWESSAVDFHYFYCN